MPRGQTYRDVHVDRPLSRFSVAHFQDTTKFVAGRFFTNMPVNNASDTYTEYPQGYFNRLHNTRRAEDGVANSVGYKSKEKKYSVEEDALRIFISDKKRANADAHRNLDMEASEVVLNALLMGKEKDFADEFLDGTTAAWTTKYEGGQGGQLKWTEDNGDPVKEVLAGHVLMAKLGAGRRPNKGLMSLDLYMELRERPDFIDRVKYSGGLGNNTPAQLSVAAIAMLFELDEIMIMETVLNQAVDGIEDVNGDPPVDNVFLASKFFLMCHIPPGAGLFTATAGMTFVWNQYLSHGLNAGPAVRRYRPQDGRKGEFLEAELAIDQKMVSPDLGILWHNML